MAIIWKLSRSTRRLLQARSSLALQTSPSPQSPHLKPETDHWPSSILPPFYNSRPSLFNNFAFNPANSYPLFNTNLLSCPSLGQIALLSTSSDLAEGCTRSSKDSDGGGVDGEPRGPEAKSEASWIDLYLPEGARPYAKLARLDKPIGTWLLAWPCMWSITLAADAGSFPDLRLLTLFGCGALLLRGAGCTVNDLLDRDIDIRGTLLCRLIVQS